MMSAKIAQALHQVMSEVAYVQKTGHNSFHGYKYAGEADLLDKLRPAMVKAGLMLLPSVKSVSEYDASGNVTVQMEYTLVHKDGDIWPEKIGAAGMGNDRAKNGSVGDKGVYKAITGANKYVLFKLFQIETGDDPEIVSEHDKSGEAPIQAPTQRRSSASLKREDVWAEMVGEINECGTVGKLMQLRQAWSRKALNDRWPAAWLDAAGEEFDKSEKQLRKMEEREADADTFPGDVPLRREISQHPLNAG
jgi:hypothetical protein